MDNYNKANLCANATLNWGMQCSYMVLRSHGVQHNEEFGMWQISSVMSTCSALIIVTNMDSFDASDAGLALACAPANPWNSRQLIYWCCLCRFIHHSVLLVILLVQHRFMFHVPRLPPAIAPIHGSASRASLVCLPLRIHFSVISANYYAVAGTLTMTLR